MGRAHFTTVKKYISTLQLLTSRLYNMRLSDGPRSTPYVPSSKVLRLAVYMLGSEAASGTALSHYRYKSQWAESGHNREFSLVQSVITHPYYQQLVNSSKKVYTLIVLCCRGCRLGGWRSLYHIYLLASSPGLFMAEKSLGVRLIYLPERLLDVEKKVDQPRLSLGYLLSQTQHVHHPKTSMAAQVIQPASKPNIFCGQCLSLAIIYLIEKRDWQSSRCNYCPVLWTHSLLPMANKNGQGQAYCWE